MAARSPRRSFASPFVVTLAAAVPVTACVVQSRPGTRSSTDSMGNPSTGQVSTTTTPPNATGGTATGPAAPGPGDTTVVANPPRPQTDPGAQPQPTPPPSRDARWTVMKQGDKCLAYVDVQCPAGATCNPPPPKAYACLPAMAAGESVKIVQKAGAAECMTEPAMPACPPNAACNPPRPQKVPCPK